ncbi:MAG TPA: hypothetical protein DCQ37_01830 [Desulfobacteraceae bacterium]|nr:hypothetical protein [Desulfobacteraceae bacterium]
MKKTTIVSGLAVLMILSLTLIPGMGITADIYETLPGQGKKCPIGKDYYFTYSFDKKPQLGTIILKIELFDKDGKKDTSLAITGDSGMPSMKGHHDSGEAEFRLNKKSEYLLPVSVVMPGDWEVKLVFKKDNNPIYRASIKFDI